MKIDQLILWLTYLGYQKYVHPEKLPAGVFPELKTKGCNSFVVWENQENFGKDGKKQDTTLVDVLFDEEGAYGEGRITFMADSKTGEVESSWCASLESGDPFDSLTEKISSFEQLVSWIENFKIEFIHFTRSSHAKN
tara:strand:- start:262 stop:672 length:411 start_codon:yes stop_codon:yes gene_type:complete